MVKFEAVNVIDESDWSAFVTETYSRPYHFQQQDGCKERGVHYLHVPDPRPYDFENDSVPEEVNGEEMGVSFSSWLARDPTLPLDTTDEWDREHGLELFWERNFYPSIEMIANDLNSKGLLPDGDYMINIDW